MAIFKEGNQEKRLLTHTITAFVLTPIVFTGYSLLVGGQVGGDGYSVDVSLSQVGLAILALAEIGAVSVFGWRKNWTVTPLVGVVGLFSVPVLFGAVPGESKAATGYLLLTLAVVLVAAGLEVVVRHGRVIEETLRSDIGSRAFAVGVLHVVLAIALEVVVRDFSGTFGFELVAGVVSLSFLFTMSLVAVIAWTRERLYSPALLLVGWFVMGVYGAITLTRDLGASSGIDWSSLSPAPDYLMSGGVLVMLFVFVVGAELTLRRMFDRDSVRNPLD